MCVSNGVLQALCDTTEKCEFISPSVSIFGVNITGELNLLYIGINLIGSQFRG